MNDLVVTVAGAAILAGAGFVLLRIRAARDRRKVSAWLRANTRDEPGESHLPMTPIAKGTGLPEERVRVACMSEPTIYRASGDEEEWSVWRQEPESVYTKRGIRFV